MTVAGRTDLILFVAGEPDSGVGDLRGSGASLLFRWSGMLVPGVGRLGPGGAPSPTSEPGESPPSEARPWHLPPQQTLCLNLVLELADELEREVTVVDMNQPGGQQALVKRWVGSADVVPILVRPDGARLSGLEQFTASTLRKFILG